MRALAHVQRLRGLVEAAYRCQPSQTQLAAQLGITSTQLKRARRQVLGHPPQAVLHARLQQQAQRELAYTTLSVKRNALELGFSGAPYFTRLFRPRRRAGAGGVARGAARRQPTLKFCRRYPKTCRRGARVGCTLSQQVSQRSRHMTSTIAVEELRVGMYIHLDGGWLSHPFPLSAFRLSSMDDIATLRGLGLRQVRWVPAKSDIAVAGLAYLATDADTELDKPADKPPDTEARPAVPSAGQAEARAAQQRREWMAAQREAAQRCERQYAEAAKAWREATEGASAHPQQAGRTTLALTQAMLDKMLAAKDVGIRLVGSGGDRAAAHALNVAVVSMLIGRTMGVSDIDMLDLGVGALLHDIGKQDLPDRLRHLEDGFNAAEINGYRDHVARGLLMGQRMGLTPGALAVIGQHHEHADGSGFPLRMSADRMSHGARIVAIVNRYDKLCNPATRVAALTPHEAVALLFAQSRSRFDPPVLNAFIRMMGVYPAGSLVQLTDDRYAMVVGVNGSRPLKPRVLVHSGSAPASRSPVPRGTHSAPSTLLVDLETVADLGIRRSLPAAKVPPAVLAALDPRPRVAYYFEPLSQHSAPMELAA